MSAHAERLAAILARERDGGAPWTALSRWAPRPGANVTGRTIGDKAEGWRVVAEDGTEDHGPASPRVHSTYKAALTRASELNRREQHAVAGWPI